MEENNITIESQEDLDNVFKMLQLEFDNAQIEKELKSRALKEELETAFNEASDIATEEIYAYKASKEAPEYTEPGNANYNADEHIVELIDTVITNSLLTEGKLSNDTVYAIRELHKVKMDLLNFALTVATYAK